METRLGHQIYYKELLILKDRLEKPNDKEPVALKCGNHLSPVHWLHSHVEKKNIWTILHPDFSPDIPFLLSFSKKPPSFFLH